MQLNLEFGLLITLIGVVSVFSSLTLIALISTLLKKVFKEKKEETMPMVQKKIGDLTVAPEAEKEIKVNVEGEAYAVKIESAEIKVAPSEVTKKGTQKAQETATYAQNLIKAPMHGKILQVLVKVGDKVETGMTVLILESMKMENAIKSPVFGTVKAVKVSPGDVVNADDVLIIID